MNTKLAWKILAATITSFILIAIAASPLAAEEPFDNSEYPYCCHDNQFGWGSGRCWGSGRYSRRYDVNKIETLNGKIVSVNGYTSRREISQGVHLLVDTGKETVEVFLAPSWYLEDRDFVIAPEDKIVITGSRINLDGEAAIVAREIKKGNATLVLRDENGFPLWRGWRQ